MLAFALANRQSKALSLLLKAVARVPPRARVPLVEAPAGVPPFLPYLAQQYPKLVADFLNGLGKHGLDEYEPSPSGPTLKRAPTNALTCDDGTMAILGWSSSTPDEGLWDTLTSDDELWAGQEVDVACVLVGVPGLLKAPKLGRRLGDEASLFRALIETEHHGIISSDVMRAAIAYKWQAFGQVTWIAQLRVFFVFLLSFLVGLALIFECAPPASRPCRARASPPARLPAARPLRRSSSAAPHRTARRPAAHRVSTPPPTAP